MSVSFRHAVTPYVQKQVKTEYATLVSTLFDLSAPGNGKKINSSKVISCLEELMYYNLGLDVTKSLFSLLDASDKPELVRLIQYFLNQLASPAIRDSSIEIPINVLVGEAGHESIPRKMNGIRLMGALYPLDEESNLELSNRLVALLSEVSNKKEAKKKKLFGKKENLEIEKSAVQQAVFAVCRLRGLAPLEALQFAVTALTSKDTITTRHALAVLKSFTEQSPETVANLLKSFTNMVLYPGDEPPVLDSSGRCFLNDIAGQIIYNPRVAKETRKIFFDFLVQTVFDVDTRIVISAINNLAQVIPKEYALGNSWSALKNTRTKQNGVDMDLLPYVVGSLLQYVKAGNQPVQHAAMKTIVNVCKSYISSLGEELPAEGYFCEQMEEYVAFLRAFSVNGEKSRYVRIQATITLMWICSYRYSQDDSVLGGQIVVEDDSMAAFMDSVMRMLNDTSIPVFIYDRLFRELLKRVAVSPGIYPVVLKITHKWCSIAPINVDTDLLIAVWKTIFRVGVQERRAVLSTVFAVLDDFSAAKSDLPEGTSQVHNSVFWFLGEHGNHICNEYGDRYFTKTLEREAKEQKQEEEDDVLIMTNELKTDSDRSILDDTLNPAIRAVVLRLEAGVSFGSWETRYVCLDALGKIAMRSGDPIRLHIYEFVAQVAVDPYLGLKSCARPLISVLDELYIAREEFLNVITDSKTGKRRNNLEDEEVLNLYAKHQELAALIRLHCHVPNGFCPLGPESKQIMGQAWNLLDKQQQEQLNAIEEQQREASRGVGAFDMETAGDAFGESSAFTANFPETASNDGEQGVDAFGMPSPGPASDDRRGSLKKLNLFDSSADMSVAANSSRRRGRGRDGKSALGSIKEQGDKPAGKGRERGKGKAKANGKGKEASAEVRVGATVNPLDDGEGFTFPSMTTAASWDGSGDTPNFGWGGEGVGSSSGKTGAVEEPSFTVDFGETGAVEEPSFTADFGQGGKVEEASFTADFGQGGKVEEPSFTADFGQGVKKQDTSFTPDFGQGVKKQDTSFTPDFGQGVKKQDSSFTPDFGQGGKKQDTSFTPDFGQGVKKQDTSFTPDFGQGVKKQDTSFTPDFGQGGKKQDTSFTPDFGQGGKKQDTSFTPDFGQTNAQTNSSFTPDFGQTNTSFNTTFGQTNTQSNTSFSADFGQPGSNTSFSFGGGSPNPLNSTMNSSFGNTSTTSSSTLELGGLDFGALGGSSSKKKPDNKKKDNKSALNAFDPLAF